MGRRCATRQEDRPPAARPILGRFPQRTLRALAMAFCVQSRVGCEAVYASVARKGSKDTPAYCTLFHHMVKSGGSSIRRQMVVASVTSGGSMPGLCVIGPETSEPCLEALHFSSVIAGYVELLRFPMEEIGRDCQYFTMMRHPIDRLVSAFFYCPESGDKQVRPDKWCGSSNNPEPLSSRLLAFAQEDWMNKAIYQLNFSSYCPPGAFCEQSIERLPPVTFDSQGGWESLQYAQDVLLDYDAVGIFAEWDLSMHLFDAVISSPVRRWASDAPANPGPKSKQRQALLRWAQNSPDIRAAVAGDLLLYDLAVSIFRRQTTEVLGVIWDD